MKADIRIDGIDPIAKLYPPCALTSKWEEGEQIENLLPSAFPGCTVSRIETEHDRALYIETDNEQVIIISGTKDNKAMGRNVFGSLPINNNGFHESYLQDGGKLYDAVKGHMGYKPLYIAGKSRGGAVAVTVGKLAIEHGPVAPEIVATYCSPPPVNRRGSRYLNSIGLHVINVINPGDVVDNLGWPLLRHYGEVVTLPKTGHFHKIPVLRRLFGHAYSSVFRALLVKYQNQKPEFDYLSRLMWWGDI
jgi:hypothetical protein